MRQGVAVHIWKVSVHEARSGCAYMEGLSAHEARSGCASMEGAECE